MKTNEELFRILIEEGFSRGDVTVFNKYTSPDFVEHQYGFNSPNAEGVKKAIKNLHDAFPDFTLLLKYLLMDNQLPLI